MNELTKVERRMLMILIHRGCKIKARKVCDSLFIGITYNNITSVVVMKDDKIITHFVKNKEVVREFNRQA